MSCVFHRVADKIFAFVVLVSMFEGRMHDLVRWFDKATALCGVFFTSVTSNNKNGLSGLFGYTTEQTYSTLTWLAAETAAGLQDTREREHGKPVAPSATGLHGCK